MRFLPNVRPGQVDAVHLSGRAYWPLAPVSRWFSIPSDTPSQDQRRQTAGGTFTRDDENGRIGTTTATPALVVWLLKGVSKT